MANPPITIGPFTNVPAPGSPIKSDWPQQITQYVVDRPKALVALGAQTSTQAGIAAEVDITGVTVTFTADAARRYLLTAYVVLTHTGAGAVTIFPKVTDAGNAPLKSASCSPPPGGSITATIVAVLSGVSGTKTYKLRASCNAGTVQTSAGEYACSIMVEDLGKP